MPTNNKKVTKVMASINKHFNFFDCFEVHSNIFGYIYILLNTIGDIFIVKNKPFVE